MSMLPSSNLLHSSDAFSYTYISLFMLTYPKSSTIHLNGDILEHLTSLNAFLDRPTPTIRTIIRLRHDLVHAFGQRFFPEKTLTIDESFSLVSLCSSFPALFGLSFPVQFLEDLALAQKTISDSLVTTDSSIKSFFSSLLAHQQPFLTSDITFLFLSILEYIEEHHLPTWHDILSTLRHSLLDDFFSQIYSFSIDLTQDSQSHTPPPSLIESHLQDLFKTPAGIIRQPSEAFKYLIIDTIDLLIQDEFFRKSTQKLVLEKKTLADTSQSTTKMSL